MTLKAKHIVEEIEGTRCSVVEKGVNVSRMNFLKTLLTLNKFEVIVAADPVVEGKEATYTIGVTDLVFNPVIAVYEMSLSTATGEKVSPAYWDQLTEESKNEYWE